jgi:hypothetical protein
MKIFYRGYELRAEREKCLGGWPLLYYSIMRESDGHFFVDSFEDSAVKVRDKIKQPRERVDAEHAEDDPWCEAADEAEFAA